MKPPLDSSKSFHSLSSPLLDDARNLRELLEAISALYIDAARNLRQLLEATTEFTQIDTSRHARHILLT